jgi:hypothetical protein
MTGILFPAQIDHSSSQWGIGVYSNNYKNYKQPYQLIINITRTGIGVWLDNPLASDPTELAKFPYLCFAQGAG